MKIISELVGRKKEGTPKAKEVTFSQLCELERETEATKVRERFEKFGPVFAGLKARISAFLDIPHVVIDHSPVCAVWVIPMLSGSEIRIMVWISDLGFPFITGMTYKSGREEPAVTMGPSSYEGGDSDKVIDAIGRRLKGLYHKPTDEDLRIFNEEMRNAGQVRA